MRSSSMLCRSLSALIVLATLSAVASADMLVQTYQPNRQERFYVGSDKAFVGAAFNWSGVGQVNGGAWATMISPTYFVSAAHWHPSAGDVLTFHADNNPSGPTYQGVVDSWYYQASTNGTPSDLWVGRLTTAIPSSANIGFYPVLDLASQSDYLGLPIYVNGKPNRIGRNNIDTIRVASEPESGAHYKSTVSMEFGYDATGGMGADECFLIGGDSGGPTFVNAGGQLALVGIHYYNYGTPDIYDWGMISGDSFVPYYLGQIEANMVGESVSTVTSVPEPASVALTILGVAGLLRRRKTA